MSFKANPSRQGVGDKQNSNYTPYLGVYVNKYSIFLPKDPTEKVSYYVKLVLIPI